MKKRCLCSLLIASLCSVSLSGIAMAEDTNIIEFEDVILIDDENVTIELVNFYEETKNWDTGTRDEKVISFKVYNNTDHELRISLRDAYIGDEEAWVCMLDGNVGPKPGKSKTLRYYIDYNTSPNPTELESINDLYDLEGYFDIFNSYEDTSKNNGYETEFAIENVVSAENNEVNEEAETGSNVLQVGEIAKTDLAEFTLDETQFANSLGLSYEDWLKPANAGGTLGAGDDKVFAYMSYTVKNLAKESVSAYDFINIKIDYMEGYIYEDSVFCDIEKFSTSSSVSSDVGLQNIEPLQEHKIWGAVKCIVKIVVSLPSTNGMVEFVYKMPIEEGAVQSEAALALVEGLEIALDKLEFAEKYAGNDNGKGSLKFADEFVATLYSSLDNVDMESLSADIPSISDKVTAIKTNIENVSVLLVEMGETNSAENVETIKSLSRETIDLIDALMQSDLSAYY